VLFRSKWSDTFAGFTVETNRSHSGLYAGVGQTIGLDHGKVRDTFTSTNEIYVSGWFNFQNLNYSDDHIGWAFLLTATLELYTVKSGSNYYFDLYYSYEWLDGGVILSVPISLDVWYLLKLHYYTDAYGSGYATLWIDEVLKGNYTFSDASPHNATWVQVGLASWSGSPITENEIVWCDDIEYDNSFLSYSEQASFPFSDNFEGNLNHWKALIPSGKGFSQTSALAYSGSKSIISNASIGDGMYFDFENWTSDMWVSTVHFYISGSVPSGQYYDVRILEMYANTTGKGLSVKWNTGSGSSSFLSIHNEWSGAESNGNITITTGAWHQIVFVARFNNASGNSQIYLDGSPCANQTYNSLGYSLDQLVLSQNQGVGYWDWYFDDFSLTDVLPSLDVVYPKQQINEGWYNFGIGIFGVGLIFAGFVFLKLAWMNGEYDKAIAFPLICWVIALGLITVLVGA
jgi:hypothetical protein